MPYARRVSIKDVAKVAGVSYSTVSRALNDNPVIRPEVRQRVQDLARSMGYSPNALAQSLHSRLTNSIGLVITTISDPFFTDVVQGVEEAAREAGLSVLLATSGNNPERELNIIHTLVRRRVDGVILAASRVGAEHTIRLDDIHIPVVMINNQAPRGARNLCSIAVDDAQGARLAMQHLLSLGHRRIAYLGVSSRPGSNERRLQGYLESMQAAGISPQKEWIVLDASTINAGFEGDVKVGQALGRKILEIDVSAAFCYCDTVATGVLVSCREAGVAVPEQLSLVGFDDNNICKIVTPPLTSVHQPKREMGQMALKMLLAGLAGEPTANCLLPPTLVVRESTTSYREELCLKNV
jgi:LacI family transcriptional regulator/LacI family repressor for deo operon, udp, cdd, tsx, nupC, and nupG